MRNHLASDATGSGPSLPIPPKRLPGSEKIRRHAQLRNKTLWESGRLTLLALLLMTLALSQTALLRAQTSGQISGHVTDSTGAILPGAEITLVNEGTQAVRTTVTTGSGDYTFTAVPPAIYTIRAASAGFSTATSQHVELQVQQGLRQDFALQVGQATASVTVSASAALLQVENASLGTVIQNANVNQLPLNGRNYLSLVALSANTNTLSPTSGQAVGRLGGDRANQSIAVGGQRIMFDYYTLDGVNNTDPDFNTYVALPSLDGIQEFKVQTGVYSAEFGHEASQVNVVSKGGTNSYHGAMYDFIRNNWADANPYFFPYNTTPLKVYPYKWNDYGFELDGPIRIPGLYDGRNKFFFMVDDEWRNIRATNQGQAVVPTVAEAQGNFQGFVDKSGNPITIYDPATGDANGLGKTPFPGNTIPKGRLDPISQKALAYYATSPTPSSGNNNYSYNTMQPQDRQGLTVRGDYNLSEKSQFAFRYSSGDESIISTGLQGAGSKIITNYYQYMGSNTWTLKPTLVNEARFGYTHFFNSLGLLSAYKTDVVGGLGIPGLNGGPSSTWGIPMFNFASGPTGTTKSIWSTIGDTQDGPYVVNDPTWQIVDNISWVTGKHSLRFGFEYARQTFNQLGNQFSRGQFQFQPLATALVTGTPGSTKLSQGDAFADFLLGGIQQSTVAVAVADANYIRNVEAAYADDTYKLLPNLTISAGLRYELTPPWNDTYGNNFTVYVPHMPNLGDTSTTYPQNQWPYFVRQGNCTNAMQGLSINWTDATGKPGTTANPPPVCSNGLLPNGPLMDTQYLNFAPRFGISYAPRPTLIVRTGFGIFYSQDTGNAYFDMARNIAGRVSLYNANSNVVVGGPSTLAYGNAVPGGSTGTAQIPPPYAFSMATSHDTTYSEQFMLNVQQQVGQDWSFEVGYLGGLSRHLYGFQNANVPTPYGYIGTGARTSIASRTPYANYGVIQLVHDAGIGNYNAFAAKATRRFSNGFNVIASYTFAKSLDDTSGVRSQGNDQLFPQNSECIRCDYGRSAFDIKNRIVGSVLYELPFGPDKLVPVTGVLDAIVGGWQLGGIFTHQTGVVATPQVGQDNSSIGTAVGTFDRPNPTGLSPYLSGSAKSLNTWANKAAYVTPTGGFYGTVQRGSFTGPGFTNLDASIHKQFHMPYSEQHQLEIRFEAFNSLNHPNWNAPNLNLSSSIFGRITGTGSMRQLQLAAKYVF